MIIAIFLRHFVETNRSASGLVAGSVSERKGNVFRDLTATIVPSNLGR